MDNPRVLLAIALSFLILLIWQAWMEDYGPKPEPAQQAAETASQAAAPTPAIPSDLPTAPTEQAVAAAAEDTGAQLPAGERVEVVTDVFHALIDTRGGDLRQVDLLRYPQSRDKGSEPFRLLEVLAHQHPQRSADLRAAEHEVLDSVEQLLLLARLEIVAVEVIPAAAFARPRRARQTRAGSAGRDRHNRLGTRPRRRGGGIG